MIQVRCSLCGQSVRGRVQADGSVAIDALVECQCCATRTLAASSDARAALMDLEVHLASHIDGYDQAAELKGLIAKLAELI